ncbi:MAG: YdcF family protein [Clostridia bacterium]|nr:YdcF family protein [Clostridia bacterium]
MLLSQFKKEDLKNLSVEEKTRLLFDTVYDDDGGKAPVGIVLGCSYVPYMEERINGAVELYKSGRIDKLMPTGSVIADLLPEKRITEAEYMAEEMIKLGVKKEDIILENNATTTIENMICSQLEINRYYGNGTTCDVFIVSSPLHLRRSKMIADLYMPKNIKKHLYPCPTDRHGKDNWMNFPESIDQVNDEITMMWVMVATGQADDIEF